MSPDKQEFYKKATQKLLQTLDGMHLDPEMQLRAKKMTLLLRNSFKLPDVKRAVFSPDLGDNWNAFTYDSDGFCLVASCTFRQMLNPQDWQLMYINEIWTYGPHHYLKHLPSGTVFDLTFDQYAHYDLTVPYEMGQPVRIGKLHTDRTDRMMTILAEKFLQRD